MFKHSEPKTAGEQKSTADLFKVRVCRFHVDMWTEQMATGDGCNSLPMPEHSELKIFKTFEESQN